MSNIHLKYFLYSEPFNLMVWYGLDDERIQRTGSLGFYSTPRWNSHTMRLRHLGKLDLKKSILLIMIAYLFVGFGMMLWSVPTFTKIGLISDTNPLSIDKLFLQDSIMVPTFTKTRLFSYTTPLSVNKLFLQNSVIHKHFITKRIKHLIKPKSSKYNFSYFSDNFKIKDSTVNSWLSIRNVSCNKRIESYANEFARFRDVVIDTKLCKGNEGGEDLTAVLNQDEEEEYLSFEPGFFKLKCDSIPSYEFLRRNHLNNWWYTMKAVKNLKPKDISVESCFTIAVTRYEYVNLYHTMTDFYNAFLMLIVFKQQPQNVRILWVDAHPKGSLDAVWKKLFAGYTRVKMIKKPVLFRHLAWSIMGYNSPLLQMDRQTLPYVEEFRDFFLKRYNQTSNKKLRCSKLNVLFIWRRDYVAHPRNPTGLVSRKIKNEAILLAKAREYLSNGHSVKGIQIDLFTMDMQLNWIVNTDILIGMHGAGMTHTLFLPKHSGVIEFYPTYWSDTNVHFRTISRWRKLKYLNWQNGDTKNEFDNLYTHIPTTVMLNMLKDIVNQMCQV